MILTGKELKMVFNRRMVFKDISFEVKSGQVLSITGPNGSGKSTASKIICGIITPTSGQILFLNDGKIVDRDEIHRHVGFVAPYLELYGEFTALENLRIEAGARGLKNKSDDNLREILTRWLV